jgi:hypothetical protein
MEMANNVRIAAVIFEGGFAIDDFLNEIAKRLRAEGAHLGGAVQENLRGSADEACAAMVLTELQSQRRFQISQSLGAQAQGCRLDAAGLADVGVALDASISRNLDLMLLNRFGVAEAEGHGLRAIFARAIEAGIPLLTAVRPPYTEQWAEFHGGLAVDLPPQLDPVMAWCRESVRLVRAARQAELAPAGPA